MTGLLSSHCVFPTPDIRRTAEFYVTVLGFRAVEYLDVDEPHICLYREGVEVILTQAACDRVRPNRELYGYGEDGYFITEDQQGLQDEFEANGATIVRRLQLTDYNNLEFTVEDIDGRWLAVGIKQSPVAEPGSGVGHPQPDLIVPVCSRPTRLVCAHDLRSDTLTPRLRLRPISLDDHAAVAAVCAIFTDARTWTHMPQARPTSPDQVVEYLDSQAGSWRQAGLGRWFVSLRDSPDGEVIGVGGCDMSHPVVGTWDLGYRLAFTTWGHGYATEVARAGLDAAHRLRPDVPVTANVVDQNPASLRVLDKIGLKSVWHGDGQESGLAYRVYSDRRLAPDVLERVIAQ